MEKYNAGAAYGTLNSARSAIALLLGDSISKDVTLSRFFKGIFKLRPSKSKYNKVWDIQIVLDEMSKLYPLASLNLVDLTEKTVILLAIATAHRVQTLASIKLDNIKETTGGFEIEIPDLIKTSRPGAPQPMLSVPFFENEKCCVARTLASYISATRNVRGSIRELFISTRKPFKPVSSQTIARWIKNTLRKCGLDSAFSAHSTRHAATSAAAKKGVSINLIKNIAGWSETSSMFSKVYNLPIREKRSDFATRIFNKD